MGALRTDLYYDDDEKIIYRDVVNGVGWIPRPTYFSHSRNSLKYYLQVYVYV